MHGPRWRIPGQHLELVLTTRGDDISGADRLSRDEVFRLLDTLVSGQVAWSLARRELNEAARYARQHHGALRHIADFDGRAVLDEALTLGVLVGWRRKVWLVTATLGDLEGEALAAIPLASALLPRTWIEIELTDMEGNPRPGERYWIELPDGTVHEGTLDRYGRAYFGDLDAGEAEIRWPDLDAEATVSATLTTSAPTPKERAWIEIELTDMEGNPRPGERYWMKLPDGMVRVGRLDANGRALVANIDPGDCEIRWPDLDDEVTVPAPDPTVGTPERELIPRRRGLSAPPSRPGGRAPIVVAPPPRLDPEAQAQALIEASREGSAYCDERVGVPRS